LLRLQKTVLGSTKYVKWDLGIFQSRIFHARVCASEPYIHLLKRHVPAQTWFVRQSICTVCDQNGASGISNSLEVGENCLSRCVNTTQSPAPTNRQTEDARTLLAAKANARDGFNKSKHLEPGSEEAAKRIHFANDVARILRENVLQGRAKEDASDVYSKSSLSSLKAVY
jgi:hypothetical protein